MNIDELTEIFRKLGAPDPQSWAESQINEGINQLARFLFLKGGWENIVADGDTRWIEIIKKNMQPDSDEPYAGVAHALRRLEKQGADPGDISEVVRGMQAQLLSDICYQLSDPTAVNGNSQVFWSLFELDEKFEAVQSINSLHESVLETDPSGREMRPRGLHD